MKSVLGLCVFIFLTMSSIQTVIGDSHFACLKRVVRETVGDDPKYAAWNAEVDAANSNAFKMMDMCKGLPAAVQTMCYQNVVTFIKGATVTLANKLSEIDSGKDWATITKPCVDSRGVKIMVIWRVFTLYGKFE